MHFVFDILPRCVRCVRHMSFRKSKRVTVFVLKKKTHTHTSSSNAFGGEAVIYSQRWVCVKSFFFPPRPTSANSAGAATSSRRAVNRRDAAQTAHAFENRRPNGGRLIASWTVRVTRVRRHPIVRETRRRVHRNAQTSAGLIVATRYYRASICGREKRERPSKSDPKNCFVALFRFLRTATCWLFYYFYYYRLCKWHYGRTTVPFSVCTGTRLNQKVSTDDRIQ